MSETETHDPRRAALDEKIAHHQREAEAAAEMKKKLDEVDAFITGASFSEDSKEELGPGEEDETTTVVQAPATKNGAHEVFPRLTKRTVSADTQKIFEAAEKVLRAAKGQPVKTTVIKNDLVQKGLIPEETSISNLTAKLSRRFHNTPRTGWTLNAPAGATQH
jgi:hypothetical protein